MQPSLADLEILAVDCQATGAHSARGHLLEIGWARARALDLENFAEFPVEAHLCQLTAEAEIPRPVSRLTGIAPDDLTAGKSYRDVWARLSRVAREVADANQAVRCPTVIHFARFEAPFLRQLHELHAPREAFPFTLICTHEIAQRLLPDLPRRGIRALAGYFGHSLPEYRRSGPHARATVLIWQQMVKRLKTTCGVHRLDQLFEWLGGMTPPSRSKDRKYPLHPSLRLNLPDAPGVYRMSRSNGDLLYIGKAGSLKRRVNSYFRGRGPQGEHTLEMLTQVRQLNVTQTGSAFEAALLESDEIKRYAPLYNVALRAGHRKIGFCSKDFQRYAFPADDQYCLGPLPSEKLWQSLRGLAVWLSKGTQGLLRREDACRSHTLLGLPPEYAPAAACMVQGLAVFRQRHRLQLRHRSPLRVLTRLGAQLWREPPDPIAQDESARKGEDDLEEKRIPEAAPHWTPENVAQRVENLIRHSAHMIRRARWLCLLSEASILWETPASADGRRILMIIAGGAVVHRQDWAIGKEPPVPPGHAQTFRSRRKTFDLMTYDRLRIATTELRRLVSEGRCIELRLGPRVRLRPPQLEKVLRWV
ncbi:MAG: GIY-YIG nuclease family protein [Desulfobacterales bacterium]|nr:MAG: GIY-YIG nuclease family protein [Desulfobacterales bacterium]